MNCWRLRNEISVRRSSVFALLVLLNFSCDANSFGQEAADDAAETAAEAGERAERRLKAEQEAQVPQRRQSEAAERQRLREQVTQYQALLEAHRKQIEAHREEFEAQRQAYAQAIAELKRNIEQQGSAAGRRDGALDLARSQLAEIEAKLREEGKLLEKATRTKTAKAAPLPENTELRVFALRHSKLPDVGRVLAEIVGDRGLRLAMDERTNSLVVTTDKETMQTVEALLLRLDAKPDETAVDTPSETLQLRIVWLLDGVDGGKSPERFVSPQVVEALAQLGFTEPKVVTQQVTTLTIGDDKRRGQFQFNVPVIINGQSWQFGGDGQINPLGNDRYSLGIELNYVRDPRTNLERGQLSGSIFTPLGHYTVMGTTTFVGTAAAAVADPAAPLGEGMGGLEGGVAASQQEFLSAFVVYLDRAQEFPRVPPTPADAPTGLPRR